MTKKKLRRLLRSTRRQLELSEMLVGELRLQIELAEPRGEAPPVWVTEPLTLDSQAKRIGELERALRRATEDADAWRERAVDMERQRDQTRRELRDAERHVQHHHDLAGKPFTLVRDVNPQTERMLRESRAQVRELEAENYALRYPPEADDFDLVDEDGCPMQPTPELPPGLVVSEDGETINWRGENYYAARGELPDFPEPELAAVQPPDLPRIAPGDVVRVTDRQGGVFLRAEVESVKLVGEGGWTRLAELHFKRPGPAPLGPVYDVRCPDCGATRSERLMEAAGLTEPDAEPVRILRIRQCADTQAHAHHAWDWTPALGDPTTFFCEGVYGGIAG